RARVQRSAKRPSTDSNAPLEGHHEVTVRRVSAVPELGPQHRAVEGDHRFPQVTSEILSLAAGGGVPRAGTGPSHGADHVRLSLRGGAQHHEVAWMQADLGEIPRSGDDLQIRRAVDQPPLREAPELLELAEDLRLDRRLAGEAAPVQAHGLQGRAGPGTGGDRGDLGVDAVLEQVLLDDLERPEAVPLCAQNEPEAVDVLEAVLAVPGGGAL